MSLNVKVYDNGDHTCLVWLPADGNLIPNCRGFTIRRVVKDKGGQFKVTMEIPSVQRPKSLVIEITAYGVSVLLAAPAAIGIATSRPARAG